MENIDTIQAISPLDGRYQQKTGQLNKFCSEYGLIKIRIRVEVEWLIALAKHEQVDSIEPFNKETELTLRDIYQKFSPEKALKVKKIEQTTNHDVKAVEYYINDQLKVLELGELIPMVHFACTSEDINNLAYALILKYSLREVIFPLCEKLLSAIEKKANQYRSIPMVARTHGQLASPTTMGKEFHNVAERLKRQLMQMKQQPLLGKINGAAGNFNAHRISFPQVDWKAFSRSFVESLGLEWNASTTQIEPHDYMAELFHQLIRWNTIVLDFDRDIWSYIAIESFTQIPIAGQVGSSTMPHKINPIDFENSEGNLGIANALLEHFAAKLPISRWQRDLSDSTVLRNIGIGLGYSSLAYQATLKGLDKLAINQEKLEQELNRSWILLGEAMQTVMRKYKLPNSYEKLKELTRGKQVDQKSLHNFINSLELPEGVKAELKLITPSSYVGYATEF
jgi:adenylosuccinate lyase